MRSDSETGEPYKFGADKENKCGRNIHNISYGHGLLVPNLTTSAPRGIVDDKACAAHC